MLSSLFGMDTASKEGGWQVRGEVNTMNWNQVQGNWKQLKGKAKQTWGNLMDQEIDVIEGKRKALASRIHAVWAQQKADRRASR
jgi:uncharacterized protein YjbJ (UPF0337 family)